MLKCKSVYLGGLSTSYVVLRQHFFYSYDNHYPHVNYLFLSIGLLLTLILDKALNSDYVCLLRKNSFDMMLNIFDFCIFKQLLASHKSGDKRLKKHLHQASLVVRAVSLKCCMQPILIVCKQILVGVLISKY